MPSLQRRLYLLCQLSYFSAIPFPYS